MKTNLTSYYYKSSLSRMNFLNNKPKPKLFVGVENKDFKLYALLELTLLSTILKQNYKNIIIIYRLF